MLMAKKFHGRPIRPRTRKHSSAPKIADIAPDAPTVRIKVAKSAQGAGLPGYTFTQEGSF